MTYDYGELDAERTKVMQEHGCECETCRRSSAICPATASTLIDELAMLRIYRRKVEEGGNGRAFDQRPERRPIQPPEGKGCFATH